MKSDLEKIQEKQSRARRYSMNDHYFKNETGNMYYILGLLYADGHLGRGRSIAISTARRHRHILEDIKREVDFEGEVQDYMSSAQGKEYESSRPFLSSVTMVSDLNRLGKTELKEESMDMSLIPERFELDFIAGFFDGDGTVKARIQNHDVKKSVTGQIILVISTKSKSILYDIQKRLQKYGVRSKNIHKSKKNCYEITYSTNDSKKIYDLFYKQREGDIFLHRKKRRMEYGFANREKLQSLETYEERLEFKNNLDKRMD